MDEEKVVEAEPMDEETANGIVDKIKDLVKEGNVTKVRIRRGDFIVLNIPMTLGVAGTILGAVTAPWGVIVATLAAIGFACTVEVEKEDGTVTIVYGKE